MRNALLTRVTSENRYLETCGSFVWLRNEKRTQSIVTFIKGNEIYVYYPLKCVTYPIQVRTRKVNFKQF